MSSETAKAELFIQAVDRWKGRLWAQDWLINVRDDPDGLKTKDEETGKAAFAQIMPNMSYHSAELVYDGPALASMSEEDIDLAALHEVCHLVSAPLVNLLADTINDVVPRGADEVYARWLKETSERVATHIERIAYRSVKEWV